MKPRPFPRIIRSLLVLCVCLVPAVAQNPTSKAANNAVVVRRSLYWAYAVNPASSPAAKVDNTPRHVPGSTATFTLAQIADLYRPPDWHPSDHPAMPEVVVQGRKPDVFACGYCHLPNGQGRPENASLAGLPAEYIAQQMADFKSGLRKSSEPRHLPTAYMVTLASKASADEVRAAAAYFAALKPRPWIRVVEAANVPRTLVAGWMLVSSGKGEEAIGQRIIEMPEDLERTELRDDTSSFVAYVPVDSISQGKALATSGSAGKTVACSLCHGPDLKGKAQVPSIAGRSPSYIVRQLYDMQTGNRKGDGTRLMKPVVRNLTVKDMVAIAAYTASLRP